MLLGIASIVKPPQFALDQAGYAALRYWGPLEFIASYNRELCTLLFLTIIFRSGFHFFSTSFVWTLGALHFLIFTKNIYFGVSEAPIIFFGAVLMLMTCASYIPYSLRSGGLRRTLITPLIISTIIFVAANGTQVILNEEVTMAVGGRFSGVTSNPQMFSLCLAVTVPALLYAQHISSKIWWPLIALTLLGVLYLAFLTGSRLALLTVLGSFILFYRTRLGSLYVISMATFVALCVVTWIDFSVLDIAQSRSVSLENTRKEVWSLSFEAFLEHPFFGIPLTYGERLGFGESSYLAAAVGTGVLGLILSMRAAFLLFQICLQLSSGRDEKWSAERSVCVSILGTMLIDSFFEAVLLGIFTLPVISIVFVSLCSLVIIRRRPSRTAGRLSAIVSE